LAIFSISQQEVSANIISNSSVWAPLARAAVNFYSKTKGTKTKAATFF
jgi:hypothetical protein